MSQRLKSLFRAVFSRFAALERPQKRLVSVVSDAVFVLFSLWAAFSLRYETLFRFDGVGYWALFGITAVATVFLFARLGLYRAVIRYLSERALVTVLGGVTGSALIVIAAAFILQVDMPRSVPFLYGALAFLFVTGTRFSVRTVLNRPRHLSKMPVLIVGAGETGLQLASALSQGIEYRPVAFVSLERDNHKTTINGLPVYDLDHVRKAVHKHQAERILLAIDESASVDRRRILESLETLPVPVQTVPSVTELVAGQARISDVRDLDIDDLLGRDPVRYRNEEVAASLRGRVVMVTGAGGSIGSELCRQIVRQEPVGIVLLEQSEFALYNIERELHIISANEGLSIPIHPLLGSVTHRRRCESIMRGFGVNIVYHAAAYKHVPLVEQNVIEGVQNNVFGTWYTAEAAIAAGVEKFVLVSTDKAVRPTNVMGASKRLAELVLQGLARRQEDTVFSMVRFGNVLGSSGSVVPLFREQIREGGPVTVTHPDIIRYFMTIPEASQLVLQTGTMGEGGEVFVLDMGDPVRIADLARRMIHLMGLTEKNEDNRYGDIEIVYSGLRPGEKLYEELLIGDDPQGTRHPRIMKARETDMPWSDLEELLEQLMLASRSFDCQRVVALLRAAPTGYQPNDDVSDLVWCNGGSGALATSDGANISETLRRIFE
ncbi:nucleoside-diphosphate sugar epimerase [Halovibrio salipaludis]|uniref:Nucleoside-diphosphate sugar epimerase n=1 Tax=Halovibrio salipaludis TaxID=2032626 RepID=A0A2A2FCV6_9GAMM|nr:nucleoside-diphosphate sugar epimerase/dehydratase [Halovibrio salipaludis]PAU82452.1 nucleoside-diphosphate sugar epimerase [Halovibrio salipaludis]